MAQNNIESTSVVAKSTATTRHHVSVIPCGCSAFQIKKVHLYAFWKMYVQMNEKRNWRPKMRKQVLFPFRVCQTYLSASPWPDDVFRWSVSLTAAMPSGSRFSRRVYRPKPPSVMYLQNTASQIRYRHHKVKQNIDDVMHCGFTLCFKPRFTHTLLFNVRLLEVEPTSI